MSKLIIHLSDIHIGSSPDRYEEYCQIFDKLSQELQNYITKGHDCTIVVTGDTFHHKTRLSSQDIRTFNYLLKSLNNLPTIIILGNHDINLNSNDGTSDLISPLLEYSKFSNVTLSKITEVVTLNGINFVHASITDKFDKSRIETLLSSVPQPVLLYHGFAVGAVLNNSVIRRGDITKDLIEKSHLTLLGDIHERSLVAPNAGYAGSLIQQNQSEDFKKGYIIWDHTTKEAIFADIKNKFCKIRLDSKDKELSFEEIQREKQKILDYFGQDVEVSTISIIGNSGETFTRQKEWVKEIFGKNVDKISMTLGRQNKKLMDSSQVLRDLLDKTPNLDPNVKDSVLKLHEEFLIDRQICQWSVKSLEWSNMMSYGPNNYINFEQFNGITGVIAKNKMGKSSIIDILCYALFGKTIRGLRSDIFRYGQKEFFVKIHFVVNNTEYIIERHETITKNKSCKFQRLNPAIQSSNNQPQAPVWENITPQDVGLIYSKYMINFVGTLENFQETSLYFQECDSIIVMSNTYAAERRKRLAKLLGTETNKDIMDAVKLRKKSEQEKLYKLQQSVAAIPANLKSSQLMREELDKQQEQLDEDLENITENDNEINELNEEYYNANNLIQTITEQMKIREAINLLQKQLEDAESELNSFLKIAEPFDRVYSPQTNPQFSAQDQEQWNKTQHIDISNLSELVQEASEITKKIVDVQLPKLTKEEIVSQLSKLPIPNNINQVQQNIQNDINLLYVELGKINLHSVTEPKFSKQELEDKKNTALNFLEQIKKTINTNQTIEDEIKNTNFQLQTANETLTTLNNNISNLLGDIKTIEYAINKCVENINDLQSKTNLSFDPKCTHCSANVKVLDSKLHSQFEEKTNLSQKISKLTQDKQDLENKQINQTQIIDQLNKKLSQLNSAENLKIGIERLNEMITMHKNIEENNIKKIQQQQIETQLQEKKSTLRQLAEIIELQNYLAKYEEAEQSSQFKNSLSLLNNKINACKEIQILREKHLNYTRFVGFEKTQKETALKQTINDISGKLNALNNLTTTNSTVPPEERIKLISARKIQIEDLIKKLVNANGELRESVGRIKSFLATNTTLLQHLITYEEQSPAIINQIKIYEIYEKMVGKTGLETEIIKNNVGEIQTKMNEILQTLTDFKIDFRLKSAKTESLELKLKIYLSEGEKLISVDMASGYQRFIINLVFRLVLTSILPFSCDFILIDEGFASADKDNLEKINEFLLEICRLYKFVFVISHLDSVQRVVDQPIVIKQTPNGNNVCVGLPENYKFTPLDSANELVAAEAEPIAFFDEVICACGARIKRSNKTHVKSKRHTDYVNKGNSSSKN